MRLSELPKKDGKTVFNSADTGSKIDKFSGQHTTSLIVAILFVFVLIAYVLIISLKANIDTGFNTSMISIMTLLIGFFTGNKSKKD